MAVIFGLFTVNGLPRNGASVSLYLASTFVTPPIKNTALPVSPVATGTTGTANGCDGAFRFTGVTGGEYYIGISYNGTVTWEYYNASSVTVDVNGCVTINLAATGAKGFDLQLSGVDKFYATTDGDGYFARNVGIGVAPDATKRLKVKQGDVSMYFDVLSTLSTQVGLGLDKTLKTNTAPHGITFMVGSAATWEFGQDGATSNTDNGGTGGSDYLMLYDYTASYNDAGARVSANGGCVFRWTSAEKSNTGKSAQFYMDGNGSALRNATTYWGVMAAGAGLSALNISCYGTGQEHIKLTQRNAANQCATFNFNGKWLVGTDLAHSGAYGFHFYDTFTSNSQKTRLFISGASGSTGAKVGVNTDSPASFFDVRSDTGLADDTVQTLGLFGYSGSLTNRSLAFQQIYNATTASQYVFWAGGLGSTSTVATPTGTGTGSGVWGWEAKDASFALVCSAAGTNTTLKRPISVATNSDITIGDSVASKIGFNATSPIGKPTVTGSRGANAALASLITALASYGLLIDNSS